MVSYRHIRLLWSGVGSQLLCCGPGVGGQLLTRSLEDSFHYEEQVSSVQGTRYRPSDPFSFS